jgi:hypothetical protein
VRRAVLREVLTFAVQLVAVVVIAAAAIQLLR